MAGNHPRQAHAVIWLLAGGGPEIGRRAAQRLARRELSEMSFWQRVLKWLSSVLRSANRAVPGGWFGLIVLAVVAVAVIAVVIVRIRPARTHRAPSAAVLSSRSHTAADYRRMASQHAAAGNYSAAIVDTVRGIAADLEERGILTPDPGRTADELAAATGRELPDYAGDLRDAASLFDGIRYGEQQGTAEGYTTVCDVAGALRSARPASDAPVGAAAGSFGPPR